MTRTAKTQEVRARVEPALKQAVEKQAAIERLDPPDIVRKALWNYLAQRPPGKGRNGKEAQ